MNLHEYQAKKILKKFDLPILKGKHFNNLNINIGEMNSYSWHVSMNDIVSDDNYFGIDATLLDT